MDKAYKQTKFDSILEKRVDMDIIDIEAIKPWINRRITEITGEEDELLIEYIINQLELKEPSGKQIQMNLSGFMSPKNARLFVTELWHELLKTMDRSTVIRATKNEQTLYDKLKRFPRLGPTEKNSHRNLESSGAQSKKKLLSRSRSHSFSDPQRHRCTSSPRERAVTRWSIHQRQRHHQDSPPFRPTNEHRVARSRSKSPSYHNRNWNRRRRRIRSPMLRNDQMSRRHYRSRPSSHTQSSASSSSSSSSSPSSSSSHQPYQRYNRYTSDLSVTSSRLPPRPYHKPHQSRSSDYHQQQSTQKPSRCTPPRDDRAKWRHQRGFVSSPSASPSSLVSKQHSSRDNGSRSTSLKSHRHDSNSDSVTQLETTRNSGSCHDDQEDVSVVVVGDPEGCDPVVAMDYNDDFMDDLMKSNTVSSNNDLKESRNSNKVQTTKDSVLPNAEDKNNYLPNVSSSKSPSSVHSDISEASSSSTATSITFVSRPDSENGLRYRMTSVSTSPSSSEYSVEYIDHDEWLQRQQQQENMVQDVAKLENGCVHSDSGQSNSSSKDASDENEEMKEDEDEEEDEIEWLTQEEYVLYRIEDVDCQEAKSTVVSDGDSDTAVLNVDDSISNLAVTGDDQSDHESTISSSSTNQSLSDIQWVEKESLDQDLFVQIIPSTH